MKVSAIGNSCSKGVWLVPTCLGLGPHLWLTARNNMLFMETNIYNKKLLWLWLLVLCQKN